jgi:hypothetical protein
MHHPNVFHKLHHVSLPQPPAQPAQRLLLPRISHALTTFLCFSITCAINRFPVDVSVTSGRVRHLASNGLCQMLLNREQLRFACIFALCTNYVRLINSEK